MLSFERRKHRDLVNKRTTEKNPANNPHQATRPSEKTRTTAKRAPFIKLITHSYPTRLHALPRHCNKTTTAQALQARLWRKRASGSAQALLDGCLLRNTRTRGNVLKYVEIIPVLHTAAAVEVVVLQNSIQNVS